MKWNNCYENDGTPDNSPWTSVVTDGILETNSSVNEEKPKDDYDFSSVSTNEVIEEEVEGIADPITCNSCNLDAKKKKVTC